jgi:hypothetical protein
VLSSSASLISVGDSQLIYSGPHIFDLCAPSFLMAKLSVVPSGVCEVYTADPNKSTSTPGLGLKVICCKVVVLTADYMVPTQETLAGNCMSLFLDLT